LGDDDHDDDDDDDEDEDDDDDGPAFAPFASGDAARSGAARAAAAAGREHPGAQGKGKAKAPADPDSHGKSARHARKPDPATSSTGSVSSDRRTPPRQQTARGTSEAGGAAAGPSGGRLGALSPRHRAELKRLSPRGPGAGAAEGSEGTPSMGSSFSDLDGQFSFVLFSYPHFAREIGVC
jgi:hypothetical protein